MINTYYACLCFMFNVTGNSTVTIVSAVLGSLLAVCILGLVFAFIRIKRQQPHCNGTMSSIFINWFILSHHFTIRKF